MRKPSQLPLFDLRQAPPLLDAPGKFPLTEHMRQVKARLFAHQAIKPLPEREAVTGRERSDPKPEAEKKEYANE